MVVNLIHHSVQYPEILRIR